jgi:fructose-bisphosphate aldolase, class I
LQAPALKLWADKDANRVAAQNALLHRARCNAAATRGAWRPAMEAA